MCKLIDRLTECGIPERAAICIYRDFRRRNSLNSLKEYVRVVEAQPPCS